MMQSLNRYRTLGVLVGVAAAVGCSNGTGPVDDAGFDPARVEASVAAVDRVSNSAVLRSFQVLGQHVNGVAATPSAVASLSGPARFARAVQGVAGIVVPTGAALVPVIRSSAYGSTYVYDPASNRYEPDPSRTGAPADGVRFVLYATSEATGRPIVEQEVGYADLRDTRAGAENTLGLSFEVVAGGVTHLQYDFDLTGSIGAATFGVEGYLSDGTERVDFDVTTSGQLFGRGGTTTVDGAISVPSHDFEVMTRLVGTAGGESGDGQVELTVRSGPDVIEVTAATTGGQVQARFTVNGQLLATATGDAANPVIRGDGGRELTEPEIHALAAVVGFADGVFRLLAGLLEPAGGLLLIALGLGA